MAGWVGEHLGPRIAFAGGGVIALTAGLVGLYLLSRRAATDGFAAEPVAGVEAA